MIPIKAVGCAWGVAWRGVGGGERKSDASFIKRKLDRSSFSHPAWLGLGLGLGREKVVIWIRILGPPEEGGSPFDS